VNNATAVHASSMPLPLSPKRPDLGERLPLRLDGLLADARIDAARLEKIRLLRTELLLRHAPGEQANMLAVLSPCAGEGRSQLAAELAVAFAQLGRPTLLVDADLRRPRQHHLFNLDNRQGLATTLGLGKRPVLHAIPGLPSLQVLPAGPICAEALELLSDRNFELLVRDWRQHFAFVVIDTPPVCEFADGLAVATVAGRLLSLSRAHHTPFRDSREMLRRLEATRTRIVGAVLNRF